MKKSKLEGSYRDGLIAAYTVFLGNVTPDRERLTNDREYARGFKYAFEELFLRH